MTLPVSTTGSSHSPLTADFCPTTTCKWVFDSFSQWKTGRGVSTFLESIVRVNSRGEVRMDIEECTLEGIKQVALKECAC